MCTELMFVHLKDGYSYHQITNACAIPAVMIALHVRLPTSKLISSIRGFRFETGECPIWAYHAPLPHTTVLADLVASRLT